MIGSIGALTKLTPLLTGKNLEYLDRVLTLLTDPASPVYSNFWRAFKATSITGEDEVHAHNAAWNGLRKLHVVVKEQKGNFR